jgi:hypothetical protein
VEANGHFDADAFEARQEQRFANLQGTMTGGFKSVVDELKLSRTEGHIPVSVMKQILDALRDILVPIFKGLCTVVVILIVWVTGMKYLLPSLGFGAP